ncbi:hypothetical protein, variant 3 [Aphanomyces astaci]|uniref:Uncharacterized protein n=1 Tax=Aphanomyces astaci TaxID=112090 RepID=W4H3K8_APHAT|nr:hypothetical protein, variant 3 [Aphanomyces astaci]ETV85738.1 hypothetical protein, variant 3 [Aphanomyces astaci]|eukprot:XP_009824209.1 hypothetical protein, variant 3 [Aphanomyces astaci]
MPYLSFGSSHVVVRSDLSGNNLATINLGDSALESINLSGGQVTSFTVISLPATLRHLDVSRNSINQLSINWARFVKLTSLNFSSNRVSYINKPVFPPSLRSLDVSNNPIYMADFDVATYTLLSGINVSYLLDPQSAQMVASTCRDVGDLRRLGFSGSVVCVFDKSRDVIQDDMFVSLRRLTLVSLFLSVTLVLGYAGLHWYRRRMGLNEEHALDRGRETLSSSACEAYDAEPIQYIQALTPQATSAAASRSR